MTHKIRGVRVEEYAYYVNKLRQSVGLETWMTSSCDVTNHAHQIQMATISHWMKPPMKSFYVRHRLRIMCGRKRLNPFFRLHQANEVLNKYVMGVWSDNFTASFFVSFIVTDSVPDIKEIQNKVVCLWSGTTCSVDVTSTCRLVLICMTSVVANLPEGPPILNSLGPRKWNLASGQH